MVFPLSNLMRDDSKETKSDEDLTPTTTTTTTPDDQELADNNSQKPAVPTSTKWIRDHAKAFLDEWTRVGLSQYVDLPMICVLGDTSSGKSSVLSSLIGLELPSASTLTTKCPVLVQLQHTQDPQDTRATIDIQWHAPKTLESPRERKRTIEKQVEERQRNDPPPPPPPPPPPKRLSTSPNKQTSISSSPPHWERRTIRSDWETQVPNVIQQAQQVILEFRDTLVAPDVICVTLWSPDCTEELTLVDLPGLVQFQHQQEIGLLHQVEQVILEYLHNPRSTLLPVLAAPTNIHNSKVLQWAKEVDPTTRRTIPVLTKPDLMDPGSETDVLALLRDASTSIRPSPDSSENPPVKFHHGFHMVKNRGQASLDAGTALHDGLVQEEEYFAQTLPWNALAEDRLGIPSLRIKLAQVLSQVMQDSMTDILQELQDRYHQTQDQLELLGPLFHTRLDQRKFYHSLSHQLVTHVSTSLSGKGSRHKTKSPKSSTTPPPSTAKGGAARLHAACHDFLQEIQGGSLATINKLVEGASVLVSSPDTTEDIKGEVVHVAPTGLYACVDFEEEKDHTTEVLFDGVGYTTEEPDLEEDEVWSDGNRVFVGREVGRFDSLRKIPVSRIRTDPTWLEEKMAHFRTDDLACFVNVDMFQQIVAEFVHDDWAPPCQKLLQCLEEILQESLQTALSQTLQDATRFPMLRTMMETTCRKVAAELMESAQTMVKDHLELEEQHPYTQDKVLLEAMNKARHQALRNDLDMQLRLDQEGVVYDTQAIQSILDKVFAKHQNNNWMAEQMELVLSCYGQVATQRVLDRTPQICWQTCRSMAKVLQEELGCVTDDVLETCLWESPETRQKYQALTNQLGDLQTAMDVVKTMR